MAAGLRCLAGDVVSRWGRTGSSLDGRGHLPAALDILYIAGFTRSGSTLLDRLLGQVPGLRSLGEMRNIWSRGFVDDELCGCGQRFSACPFWRDVAVAGNVPVDAAERAAIAGRAARLDRTRNVPLLLATGPSRPPLRRAEHLARLGDLYRAVAGVSGCAWLVDSSKQASYAAVLTEVPGLRLHVVHLIRDSRAVAHSWSRPKRRADTGREGELMPLVSARRAAVRWSYHNFAVELMARRAETRQRVRYEDLVVEPERVLRFVLLGAGAPAPPSFDFLSDDGAELAPAHTVSGNPIRLGTGPTPMRLDDEWATAMPGRDARAVSSLTSPLLRRYGYRVRP